MSSISRSMAQDLVRDEYRSRNVVWGAGFEITEMFDDEDFVNTEHESILVYFLLMFDNDTYTLMLRSSRFAPIKRLRCPFLPPIKVRYHIEVLKNPDERFEYLFRKTTHTFDRQHLDWIDRDCSHMHYTTSMWTHTQRQAAAWYLSEQACADWFFRGGQG